MKKLSLLLCVIALVFGIIRTSNAAGTSITIPIDIRLVIGTIGWNDYGATIIDPDSSHFFFDISSNLEDPVIHFDMSLNEPSGVFDGYNFVGYRNPPVITSFWSLESGDDRPNYEGDFDIDLQSLDGLIMLDLHNWGSGPDFIISIISTEFIGYSPTNLLFAGYGITEGYFLYSVPVPAGLWLLGAGLIGLVGLRRKLR